MTTSLHNFCFNYDGVEKPKKIQQNLKDILSTAPKNIEWRGTYDDLYQYQGFWYSSPFLEAVILAQEQFQAQSNDIILCSAPKTGTTWLKALAFAIKKRTSSSDSSNPLLTSIPHDCVPWLELDIFQNNSKEYPNLPLLATHLPYNSLPKSIINSNSKIVYICREPKDNFVSLYHFICKMIRTNEEGGPFIIPIHKAFDLFCRGISMYGPYLDHVLGYWHASQERPEKILFLKYEELKKDTSIHVKRLAEFVGHPFTVEEEREGMVQKIMELCSFESLSEMEVNKNGESSVLGNVKIQINSFFRKGEIGDWNTCLTTKMKERLDEITELKLKGSGLRFGSQL